MKKSLVVVTSFMIFGSHFSAYAGEPARGGLLPSIEIFEDGSASMFIGDTEILFENDTFTWNCETMGNGLCEAELPRTS